MKFELKHQKVATGKVSSESPYFGLIQQAYSVFKQAPTEHAVCDCCLDPEIRKNFFRYGQENMPLHYLQDWFFAAVNSPIQKSSWRFVLPRILEVLASGDEPSNTGIEVSLNRFETGNLQNWAGNEWAVLNEFQKLFLTLADQRPDDCLDDILCMFVIAGWPAVEIFTQVLEWPTDKLINKLWKDWCDYRNPSIWVTAFWDDPSVPMIFYTSNAMLEKITNYALNDNTPIELAEKAMAVSDLISVYPSQQ